MSYAEFEATAFDKDGLDLAEDDQHEQKKQCIQHARSMWSQCHAHMLLIYDCSFSVQTEL